MRTRGRHPQTTADPGRAATSSNESENGSEAVPPSVGSSRGMKRTGEDAQNKTASETVEGRASKQNKKRNIVQEQKKRDRIEGLVEQYPNIIYLNEDDSCDTCHTGRYRCALIPSRHKCVSCHTMVCTWDRTNGVRGPGLVGECLDELDLLIKDEKEKAGTESALAQAHSDEDDGGLLELLDECKKDMEDLQKDLAASMDYDKDKEI